MIAATPDISPLSRLASRVGRPWILAGVWCVLGAAAVVQRAMDRTLSGGQNDLRAVAIDVWLILLWALATPAILRTARRFPVRAGHAVRHALLHLVLAVAFVLATNVLIRLPMLFDPAVSFGDCVRDLGWALVHFGPTALMLFGIIVAVGHLPLSATSAAEATPPLATESAPDTPVPAPSLRYAERIAVREWSRPRLVRACDVEWAESDDNYVIVQVAGRTYKGRGRISELAEQLDPAAFVRIHRSAVVRLASVREVQPLAKGDLAVVLHDGKTMRVARSRRASFEAALGHRL